MRSTQLKRPQPELRNDLPVFTTRRRRSPITNSIGCSWKRPTRDPARSWQANRGIEVMKTTIGSTAAFDQALARRLPPDLLRTVLAYEDELQRLQAKPAQQTQTMRRVKEDAARAKDVALQAAVAMVLTIKRKTLMHEKGWRDRASFIMTQLTSTPTAYGLPADYADHARERDIRLVREVLHGWEKINGCYRKSVPPN